MRCYVCLKRTEFLFPLYAVQIIRGEFTLIQYEGVCQDCHEHGFRIVLRRFCTQCRKRMYAALIEKDRVTARCPKCGKETTFKRK